MKKVFIFVFLGILKNLIKPKLKLRLIGGLAQLARASALQAEGQGFESLNLHYVYRLSMFLIKLIKG